MKAGKDGSLAKGAPLIFLRYILVFQTALISATVLNVSFAAPTVDIAKDFEWVDLSACRTPPKPLPRTQKESYRTYNIQRRYVDLDRDGTCELMDLWIERLGENPSPGMRVLGRNYFEYSGAKWATVSMSTTLKFYPYAVLALKTGETIYIEAPIDADVSDNIVLGMREIRLFVRAGWDETPGFLKELILKPYEGRPGPILQALAVFLTERFVQQEAAPRKRLAGNPRFDWDPVAERERIVWILKEANDTLRPDERVATDATGLPVLRKDR